MTDFHALIDSYQNCACGQAHTCAIRDIEIGSGLVSEVGEILKKNGFGPRLLLTADEQTLAAADGIEASLVRLYHRAAHLAVHPRGDHAGCEEDRKLL